MFDFLKPPPKPLGPREAVFWEHLQAILKEDPQSAWDDPSPPFCESANGAHHDEGSRAYQSAVDNPSASGASDSQPYQVGRISVVPTQRLLGLQPPLQYYPQNMTNYMPPRKVRRVASSNYGVLPPHMVGQNNGNVAGRLQGMQEQNNNGVDHQVLRKNWKPLSTPMPGLVALGIDVIGTPDKPVDLEKLEEGYGALPHVPNGMWWQMRLDCSRDGVHRPSIGGIHGGPIGAYSICMSGGYDENEDHGDTFWFCGEGGRDLKGTEEKPKNARTAAQTRDMVWSKGNVGLLKSRVYGTPVRVVRGVPKKKYNVSQYAPLEGYRYDGLYQVTDYQEIIGNSGFRVFRFKFERLPGQEPIVTWNGRSEESSVPAGASLNAF